MCGEKYYSIVQINWSIFSIKCLLVVWDDILRVGYHGQLFMWSMLTFNKLYTNAPMHMKICWHIDCTCHCMSLQFAFLVYSGTHPPPNVASPLYCHQRSTGSIMLMILTGVIALFIMEWPLCVNGNQSNYYSVMVYNNMTFYSK